MVVFGALSALALTGVAVYFLVARGGETGGAVMPAPVPSASLRPPSGPPVMPLPVQPPPVEPPPVEPPPVEASADGPEVRGSLDREVIRTTIRRHVNEVRFCYETALAHDPALAGRVVVSFIISSTGAVQSAAASESTLSGPHAAGVSECVVDRVRTWTFPPPDGGGIVGVNYPFVFSSSP